ncbi:MAG: hypothetical protein AAB913_01840 [Patescibacteria group bacterium]
MFYLIIISIPVLIFIILLIIKTIYKHKNPNQEPKNNGLSMVTKGAGMLALGTIIIVILLVSLGIWALGHLGPIG